MTKLDCFRTHLDAAHAALDAAGAPPTGTPAERIRMLDRAWAMRLQVAEAHAAQWQALCKDSHGATDLETLA